MATLRVLFYIQNQTLIDGRILINAENRTVGPKLKRLIRALLNINLPEQPIDSIHYYYAVISSNGEVAIYHTDYPLTDSILLKWNENEEFPMRTWNIRHGILIATIQTDKPGASNPLDPLFPAFVRKTIFLGNKSIAQIASNRNADLSTLLFEDDLHDPDKDIPLL